MGFDWGQNIRDFSEEMCQIIFKASSLMRDPLNFKENWPEATGSSSLLTYLLTHLRCLNWLTSIIWNDIIGAILGRITVNKAYLHIISASHILLAFQKTINEI